MHLCRTVSRLIRHSLKTPSIDCNVIHVNLHNALYHVTENTKHTSLKCGRGITQAKGHSSVCICAKWACEGGLFLVFYSNFNLNVS